MTAAVSNRKYIKALKPDKRLDLICLQEGTLKAAFISIKL